MVGGVKLCPSQIIPVGIHTWYWTFLWPCAWWSPLRLPRWVYGYPAETICDTEPAHLWHGPCTAVTQSQRNSHRNMAMTLLCSCFTLERQYKCDTLGLTHAPSIIWYSSALQVHFIARTCCKDGSTIQYSTDVTWCWCKPSMIYWTLGLIPQRHLSTPHLQFGEWVQTGASEVW